jgi:hypothetical protein
VPYRLINGKFVEGHVPADQVLALSKRDDLLGVAAPGMPMGSPGMEMDGMSDAYQVIGLKKTAPMWWWRTTRPIDFRRLHGAVRGSLRCRDAAALQSEAVLVGLLLSDRYWLWSLLAWRPWAMSSAPC